MDQSKFEDKIKIKIQDSLIELLTEEEIMSHIKSNVEAFFSKTVYDTTNYNHGNVIIPTSYQNKTILLSSFDMIINTMIREHVKELFIEFKNSEEYKQTYEEKTKGIFSDVIKNMFIANGDKILFGMFAQMMQHAMSSTFNSNNIQLPNMPNIQNPL